MRYVRKPKEVEAMFYNGKNYAEICEWSKGLVEVDYCVDNLSMKTKYGKGIATPGTWVVKGSCGLFYPCSDKEFQDNYWELAK